MQASCKAPGDLPAARVRHACVPHKLQPPAGSLPLWLPIALASSSTSLPRPRRAKYYQSIFCYKSPLHAESAHGPCGHVTTLDISSSRCHMMRCVHQSKCAIVVLEEASMCSGMCRSGGGYAAQFKASRGDESAPDRPASQTPTPTAAAATGKTVQRTAAASTTATRNSSVGPGAKVRSSAAHQTSRPAAGPTTATDESSPPPLALLQLLPQRRSDSFGDSAEVSRQQGTSSSGTPAADHWAASTCAQAPPPAGCGPSTAPVRVVPMHAPQAGGSATWASRRGLAVDSSSAAAGNDVALHMMPATPDRGAITPAQVAAAICPHVDNTPKRLGFFKRVCLIP